MAEAKVILLTREIAHNGGRKILNQEEVVNYLHSRYDSTFTIFNGGYNLSKSQELFRQARLVLGVHGGAFYNINYSPVETIVAEYVPLDENNIAFEHGSSQIVWSMTSMIGQRFYRLAEKPSQGINTNLQINLEKLKTLLDEVDKIQLGRVPLTL